MARAFLAPSMPKIWKKNFLRSSKSTQSLSLKTASCLWQDAVFLFAGVQLHHAGVEFSFAQQGDGAEALVDGLVDQTLLFLARPMQHEVCHGLLQAKAARVADADAQAPIVLRAERGGDVFEAVVTAG